MRIYRLTALLGLLLFAGPAAAQGLKFSGCDHPIDERTSYDVFGDKTPAFTGQFDVAFELALYPEWEIGYIFRLKNKDSDRIYNLFFDHQGDDYLFRLNDEGKSSLILARLDRGALADVHWFPLKIAFDLRRDSVSLTIAGRTFGAGRIGLADRWRPTLLFGRSDHIIDVPSVAIRNLRVGNGSRTFSFPLSENAGTTVYDAEGRAFGRVACPEWLINDAYRWRRCASFDSQTVAGANYNPERKQVYYFNRDTITVYNIKTGHTERHAFPQRCPVELTLGTNFLDLRCNRLYAYEVYSETSPPLASPSVAGLDLASMRWTAVATDRLPTQLHHHGAFFDPAHDRYTIFGGFGNMRFSRDFWTYECASNRWRQAEPFAGDPLFPRYFSSVGYDERKESIYVFGGMGNESGEQVVGRLYFYDLHRVDLASRRITKLWEIPWEKRQHVVPVRGMVLADDSCFYTLCYPESCSDSFLRLYRFSLSDGSYEILGDSIPIHSDKITTNANLYYDEGLNALVATVQEFEDDIRSDLKVYSLAFPPISARALAELSKHRRGYTRVLFPVVLILTAAGGALWLRLSRRKKRRESDANGTAAGKAAAAPAGPNSICLFGEFAVCDRRGRDITYLFSARLKQTFCLVLEYSAEGGIPSQRLSSLLWPDKPENKVKNSRGVTMNHLRKILSELDGIELVYNKGCFCLMVREPLYCDYTRCLEILASEDAAARRAELMRIVSRGKFLKGADHPLFDTFKEKVERLLEPVLLGEIDRCFAEEEFASVVTLCDALFDIDPLHEEALASQIRALQRLKQSEKARIRYQAFVAEYKKINGRDYAHPFKSI